jgi:hypothetical protein
MSPEYTLTPILSRQRERGLNASPAAPCVFTPSPLWGEGRGEGLPRSRLMHKAEAPRL